MRNPDLTAERRTGIEHLIEEKVFDLAAVAECKALSPDDPLRKAAAALHQAFVAVTSGPVAEEALALGEVSHRSPLASWKLLVRAIECFYRSEDDACRQYLDRIKANSAPARLVPAMRKMLGDEPGTPLTGAPAELVSGVTGGEAELRRSLEELDRSFAGDNQSRIFENIRVAVRECRANAPTVVERLRKHIAVRCAMIDLDNNKVTAAIGGSCRRDASFLRLFARGMEATGDPGNFPVACLVWDEFRIVAVQEGWFKANGVEAAALYLHMASVLRKIPGELMEEIVGPFSRKVKAAGGSQDLYCLQPEKLYERACALGPHSGAFAQWLAWAHQSSTHYAEEVAKTWHTILPGDIEPVLHLMKASERTGAFHTALEYLTKAERIDSLHTDVRNARLRLLAGNAMRQIQQKKTGLAEKTLDAMAALPQAQEGDRAALVAALRYMASAVAVDSSRAAAYRVDIERLLEGRVAASILIAGVAATCRRGALEKLGPVQKLSATERAALPATLARIIALAKRSRLKLDLPWNWVVETAKQLKKSHPSLDADQLCALGEAGLFARHFELAYAASTTGLERGGASEAEFLLLRAKALPDHHFVRRAVCAATAAELARRERNLELVEDAVGFLRDELATDGPPITLKEAAEVLRKEKAEPGFPKGGKRGPDYSNFAPSGLCPCPVCRPARGEFVDAFEDMEFDDDPFDDDEDPADLEFLDQLFSQVIRTGSPPNTKKKGKRK